MDEVESRSLRPKALSSGHFRRIAHGGWGDGHNAYAYSCAWFRDHVYIGANRYVLPLIFKQATWDVQLDPPPVPIPSYYDMDLRGQIWRYSPEQDEWDRAYRAPFVQGPGRKVPLFISYRCMTVFQGKSESAPSIYLVPIQGRGVPRRVMLRSPDGENWEELPPPLCEGEAGWRSWRGVIPFKGKLFAAPASGQVNLQKNSAKADEEALTRPNTASGAFVRCSDDPLNGKWRRSSPTDMGDPTNRSIMDMGVCGEHLYVGTLNIREGCQLWRTDGEGPGPHHWEKVLDHGADRGQLNQAIQSMAEFQGSLYLGTCIQNGGHDKENNIGPAAGEVIRFNPDDKSWDLIVGDARHSRQGFKVPLSGQTAGFTNPFSGYIWRMTEHDGALYVSTGELTAIIQFTDRSMWPQAAQRVFDEETVKRFLELRGGAELWRTTDGNNWIPVTVNGFGNIFNGGIRSLLSTPKGLFVGTANPYGRQIAVEGPGGWRYIDNPRGGVEVWHGSLEHQRLDEPEEVPMVLDPRAKGEADVRRVVPAGPRRAGRAAAGSSSVAELEEVLWDACRMDPSLHLSVAERDLLQPAETVAEELERYYGGDALHTVGYWREGSESPREASRALLVEVLSFLPGAAKAERRRGQAPPPPGERVIPGEEGPRELPDAPRSLLVLGTGGGSVARELFEHHGAEQVTVCVAEASAGRAVRALEPRARTARWRGGKLPREARGHEACIWIEGPGRSRRGDRAAALRAAGAALAPGGWLLAADWVENDARRSGPDLDALRSAYEHDLAEAGFTDVRLRDATDQTWRPFFAHSRRVLFVKKQFLQLDAERHAAILAALPGGTRPVAAYYLFSARRPD